MPRSHCAGLVSSSWFVALGHLKVKVPMVMELVDIVVGKWVVFSKCSFFCAVLLPAEVL